MAYALVTLEETTMSIWILDVNENWEYSSFVAPAGTIRDLIAYDGVSEYTAPPGARLEIVPDTARIGDPGY
jgi:hypothetical protein